MKANKWKISNKKCKSPKIIKYFLLKQRDEKVKYKMKTWDAGQQSYICKLGSKHSYSKSYKTLCRLTNLNKYQLQQKQIYTLVGYAGLRKNAWTLAGFAHPMYRDFLTLPFMLLVYIIFSIQAGGGCSLFLYFFCGYGDQTIAWHPDQIHLLGNHFVGI